MLNRTPPFAEFAARLREARAKKYAKPGQAAAIVHERTGLAICTYYKHEKGTRLPRPDTVKLYAALFETSARWLLDGGENANDFNQLTRSPAIDPSQNDRIRFIPLLTAEQIVARLAGNGHTMKTLEKLPVPARIGAGERAFAWQIPMGDLSMVGAELAFAPGTFLIVDPDQEIYPNQLVLARKSGKGQPWLFRRYHAGEPYTRAARFELIAIAPDVPPESAARIDDYEIAGRVIYTLHRW